MTRPIAALLLALCLALLQMPNSQAANTPCSGSKGGISHCAGGKFVCNDGSISASKRICDMPNDAPQGLMSKPGQAADGICSCRVGKFCTGPRGGTFCYSDNGRKSYIRK